MPRASLKIALEEHGKFQQKYGYDFPSAKDFNLIFRRLILEEELKNTLVKLPLFICAFLCFLNATMQLQPADRIAMVHKQLVAHFHLDRATIKEKVHHLDDVYDFAKEFEHLNEQFMASSALFWCESRFTEKTWDDSILAPVVLCRSPRLNAIGFSTNSPTTWGESDIISIQSGRRLNSWRHLEGSDDGSCRDNNTELKREESHPNITCENSAAHICNIPLGITLCPKTCGYCPPFTYERYKAYTDSLIALLPVVIHQTRFQLKPCENFARYFNSMPPNEDLNTLPALDGEKQEDMIKCIDRGTYKEDTWGLRIKCPEDGPEAFCADGYMYDSRLHYYPKDKPIYAKFLQNVDIDIKKMRAIDWLDMQTAQVKISTLIYTAGLDIFTSVSVNFDIDEAGNLQPRTNMISFTDLQRQSDKNVFRICLCISSTLCLISICNQLYILFSSGKSARGFVFWYSFWSRVFMAVYSVYLLISQSYMTPLQNEYQELMQRLLDFHEHGPGAWDTAIEHYFVVKRHIYDSAMWLLDQRTICYFLFFQQLLQLIAFMSVHPGVAMLTDTIVNGAQTLAHFFLVFVTLFVMLGLAAHWMLGSDIEDFATLSESILTQTKMLYGEFLEHPDSANLTESMTLMYWVWAVTHMVVVYLTLLNFFLAIIVESFINVQHNQTDDQSSFNVAYDLWDIVASHYWYRKMNWPKRRHILLHIENNGVTESLLSIFPIEAAFQEFIKHYMLKLNISSHASDAEDETNPQQKSVQEEFEVLRETNRLLREDNQCMREEMRLMREENHSMREDIRHLISLVEKPDAAGVSQRQITHFDVLAEDTPPTHPVPSGMKYGYVV